MAITLDEPTLLETFLHYGLFLGAMFQIACIFAVVFIPYSENEEEAPEEQPTESGRSSQVQSPSGSRKIKKEKKKHR